jgi:hypothetical protein
LQTADYDEYQTRRKYMLNTINIPKKSLPVLLISSTTLAILASKSSAGPLTSSKTAFDEQMKLIEGTGGSGVAALGAPLFAIVIITIIIFTVVTLGMAAFDGGGNLPMTERVKNVLVPAMFITFGLGVLGGLVTWIATI